MPNPGQPTVGLGATTPVVRGVHRAPRRDLDLGLLVDGVFGPETEEVVVRFQRRAGVVADRIVSPLTWNALPNGEPMPTLSVGASGPVVSSLQTVTKGALVQWTAPGPIDGTFRPLTRTSVKAFQALGGAATDSIVGDQTRSVSPRAASATREIRVGLEFLIG